VSAFNYLLDPDPARSGSEIYEIGVKIKHAARSHKRGYL